MKNLILENWCKQDIPDKLLPILEKYFPDNQEYWFQFQSSYWPVNRQKTLDRFNALETDDNIICSTVFDGFLQLEIMAVILNQIPGDKVLNFYIQIYNLKNSIQEYLKQRESEYMPNTDEYNDSPQLRIEFKKDMNKQILKAIERHNIYHISLYGKEITKINVEDFNVN